ncbi:MAG TPA: hypothetical protein VN976_13060 [Verrucomicrobiae bacterium]|nr:hypothetical protein [Verrucomicrobiae bacterium]
MKTAAITMVGVLLLAGGLSAQKTPSFSVRNGETFTGEITDSFCAQGHYLQITKSERSCILTCVKFEGAQFVLYNSETKHIYNLDDQLQPEAFAGQEVTVTGRYDKEAKAIHVISIKPKITYASL